MNQMRITLVAFLAVLLLAVSASSAEGDHVSVYAGGFSLGGASTFSAGPAEDAYLVLAWNNIFTVTDHLDLFADVEWLGATDANLGFAAGLNARFTETKIRPFAGAGVGVNYLDHGSDFSKGFGMTGRVQAGVEFDVSPTLGISFTAPYRYTRNAYKDQSVGVQIGMLFYGAHKNIHVIQ